MAEYVGHGGELRQQPSNRARRHNRDLVTQRPLLGPGFVLQSNEFGITGGFSRGLDGALMGAVRRMDFLETLDHRDDRRMGEEKPHDDRDRTFDRREGFGPPVMLADFLVGNKKLG